jgi:site-specific recombinase XerD
MHLDPQLLVYFERSYWPRKLGKSPRTADLYRLTIARFSEQLERPARLSDLNDDAICAFLSRRLEDGRAGHTVDKERDKLVALANFAARKKHIDVFPDVPPVPTPDVPPQAMRHEQLNMLLAACDDTPGMIGGARASHWWRAHVIFSRVLQRDVLPSLHRPAASGRLAHGATLEGAGVAQDVRLVS